MEVWQSNTARLTLMRSLTERGADWTSFGNKSLTTDAVNSFLFDEQKRLLEKNLSSWIFINKDIRAPELTAISDAKPIEYSSTKSMPIRYNFFRMLRRSTQRSWSKEKYTIYSRLINQNMHVLTYDINTIVTWSGKWQ